VKESIVIIGAGPIGLSLACSLAQQDLQIYLIEKNSLNSIANPKEDGREIALTHLSLKILKKIKVWDLIDQTEISILKEAKVYDGGSQSLLDFKAKKPEQALGYLLPNYQIRQALYRRASQYKNIKILSNTLVEKVITGDSSSQVILDNESLIEAKLVVAADSRFSQIRKKMGIATLIEDFSKVMIVTKMQHEKPHNNIALERFDYGKTLALLPMPNNHSSVVLTVKANEAEAVLEMNEAEFNILMTQDFKAELGQMKQVGARHSYPLVATHAKTFIAKRFALIGDAAVGMHPVTAHGFNLGLKGQDILADLVIKALENNQDIGSKLVLTQYEKTHILLTRIMFFGTNGIVALFTNDAPFIKKVRRFVLKFAQHFPPIKLLISNHLTQAKQHKFLP
jgi:ubiquinone biosynthesis UbiH/UbiF/VisC/COQ6 family hydroxylase